MIEAIVLASSDLLLPSTIAYDLNMAHFVIDAVAKRHTRRPLVQLFLSVSDDSAPVSDLAPGSIHVEPVEGSGPMAVTAIYPEAYLPGKYVAILESEKQGEFGPEGRCLFRVQVDHPLGGGAHTLVYLAPLNEE